MLTLGRAKHTINRFKVVLIQRQGGRPGIESYVFGVDRLGDSDHAILAQDPGQAHLGRCHLMAMGDLLKGWAEQQLTALGDRTVSHQRQMMLLPPWQQVEFDPAFFDVIEHLVGCARWGCKLLQVRHIEVGNAPPADLARLAQTFEGFNGFFQWVLAAPVQQVQVNVIGAQALKAGFTGTGTPLRLALWG